MATKRYNFKFHCLKDRDIIDRIDSQENKQNYIRGLILSDIAADILRDSIKLDDHVDVKSRDSSSIYPEVMPKYNYHYTDELKISDEDLELLRQDWYSEHCPAIGDPDCNCEGCVYSTYPELGTDKIVCDAEKHFREYVREQFYADLKKHLSSCYGKAVSHGKLQQP